MVKESQIFQTLVRELEERGYEFFIHVPGPHRNKEGYRSLISANKTHRITINGQIPDIIGYSPSDKIVAIEVKGDKNLSEGIGQATVYREGVHRSYLAADTTELVDYRDTSRSNGIGVIGVASEEIDTWEEPPSVLNRNQLPDVKRQLELRLQDRGSISELATLELTQPLNFLAPVLALKNHGKMTDSTLCQIAASEYNFRAMPKATQGAMVLNLIEQTNQELSLTDSGKAAARTLRGHDVCSLDDLELLKNRTSHTRSVYNERQGVAVMLRKQYEGHPEFRSLQDILMDVDQRIEVPKLTEQLARRYPNVFLNLFCNKQTRPKARHLLEEEGVDALHADFDTWIQHIRQNTLRNFTHQLRHIGVLSQQTKVHWGAKSEFKPSEHSWILPHGFW